MTRAVVAFRRIGGPDAVTWLAFVACYLSAVIGHLTTGGVVNASIPVRILVVTVAVVLSFVPLLVVRFAILRDPGRPRPAVALAAFAVSAVIRGSVIAGVFAALGAAEPLWAYRISAALQGHLLILIGVALAVGTFRAQARTLVALEVAEREIVETETALRADIAADSDGTVAEVKRRLQAELDSLRATNGSDFVRDLQRLASDVVRPMSHLLAVAFPANLPAPDAAVSPSPRSTRTLAFEFWQPPFRPVASAAFMALLLTTAAIGVFGVERGLPLTMVAVGCIVVVSGLANALLGRLLPLWRRTARVIAVAVTSLIVGFMSSTASSIFVPPSQDVGIYIGGGGVYIAAVVLFFAGYTDARRQQAEAERELRESRSLLERQLVRLRQTQWVRRQRLAQALHGPLQSAVTSATLRLSAALERHEVDGALLAQVRAELLGHLDVVSASDESAPSFELALERTRRVWGDLCSIELHAEAAARRQVERDPLVAAVLIDVVTEAVSNAVRHGRATHVTIALEAHEPDLLVLTVRDDGEGPAGAPGSGLGERILQECTLSWQRSSTPLGSCLTASIPTLLD